MLAPSVTWPVGASTTAVHCIHNVVNRITTNLKLKECFHKRNFEIWRWREDEVRAYELERAEKNVCSVHLDEKQMAYLMQDVDGMNYIEHSADKSNVIECMEKVHRETIEPWECPVRMRPTYEKV